VKGGKTSIERKSTESSVTVPDVPSIHDLFAEAEAGGAGLAKFERRYGDE